MIYDLIAIGSAVRDIFVITDRGKIFKTPNDKLAPFWIGFELGEKICVNEEHSCLGGVAASLAIGTKKIGLKSSLLSTVPGNFDWVVAELEKHGIDTRHVSPVHPQKFSLSIIIVDKKTGERVILYNHDSGHISISLKSLPRAKYYSISSLTGPWTKKVLKAIPAIKKKKGKLIVMPCTNQIRNNYPDFKKLVKETEIILLNRNEANEIAVREKSGDFSTRGLVGLIHKLGPKTIALTDGMKGSWASDGKRLLHSPILKVKTVDATGAGDAFAGGFLGFFLQGKSLEDSLKAGIINGASVVQYPGITKGLLGKKDIEKNSSW